MGESDEKKGHHFIDKYLFDRQGYLDNYVVPEFEHCIPQQIERREIDDWLLDLRKKDGTELSGSIKNKILYTLSLVFEELMDLKIVTENPVVGIKSYDKSPVSPRGAIDRNSLAKLYPITHGAMVHIWGASMWVAMMLVFNDTGSRPGEVRALR
ncbi:MAG: hypothetical protein LBB80_04195 [Treponema sp.]|nr:hypothetical protein [Treponema sp.]